MVQFNFASWFETVDIANPDGKEQVRNFLEEESLTTRGTLLGLDVNVHLPAEFKIGWRTALIYAISELRGMLNTRFCYLFADCMQQTR